MSLLDNPDILHAAVLDAGVALHKKKSGKSSGYGDDGRRRVRKPYANDTNATTSVENASVEKACAKLATTKTTRIKAHGAVEGCIT